jgi:hypothetical protein
LLNGFANASKYLATEEARTKRSDVLDLQAPTPAPTPASGSIPCSQRSTGNCGCCGNGLFWGCYNGCRRSSEATEGPHDEYGSKSKSSSIVRTAQVVSIHPKSYTSVVKSLNVKLDAGHDVGVKSETTQVDYYRKAASSDTDPLTLYAVGLSHSEGYKGHEDLQYRQSVESSTSFNISVDASVSAWGSIDWDFISAYILDLPTTWSSTFFFFSIGPYTVYGPKCISNKKAASGLLPAAVTKPVSQSEETKLNLQGLVSVAIDL